MLPGSEDGQRRESAVTVDDGQVGGASAEVAQQAAEERAAARREQIERLRRGSLWFVSVMLLAVLIGLMIARVVNGQIPWGGVMPMAATAAPARLLEARASSDAQGLILELQLDRPVRYRRSAEEGALSLYLQGATMSGVRSGRLGQGASSLAWRIQAAGDDLQVLLVGLGGALQVADTAQQDGDGWHLRLQVPVETEKP
jgi:MSHA biogenesis protein MshN